MNIEKDINPFILPNKSILDYFVKNSKRNILLLKSQSYCPKTFETMVGLIKDGRLKIELSNEEGETRLMWFLEKGCILSCFTKNFYQKATALETTEILLISKDDFFKLVKSDQDYFDFFLNQIYKKFEYCADSLIMQGKEISQVRVYKLIQELGKLYGKIQSDDSIYIKNFCTKNDLASIVGIHRSNFTKYLSDLEHMDIIKKEKHCIIIKQPKLLEELINSLE